MMKAVSHVMQQQGFRDAVLQPRSVLQRPYGTPLSSRMCCGRIQQCFQLHLHTHAPLACLFDTHACLCNMYKVQPIKHADAYKT